MAKGKELESSSFSITSRRRKRSRCATCCCVASIIIAVLVLALIAAILAVELTSKPGYDKLAQDTHSLETMQQLQTFRTTVPEIVRKQQQNEPLSKEQLVGWVRRAAAMVSASYTATFDAHHVCATPVGANLTRTFAGSNVRAMLVRDDVAQQNILAFKGPSSMFEIMPMLHGKLVGVQGKGQIHEAYQKSFLSIQQPILDALQAAQPYPLLVTGHSSGAAVAVLMALAIKEASNVTVSVVTLGEPMMGDESFATFVESVFPPSSMQMIRAVHSLDGVPHAPVFSGSGFVHHAGEVWQFRDPATADNMVICAGRADGHCSASIKAPTVQLTPPSLAMNAEHWHYADIELGSRQSKQCGMGGGQPWYVLMMPSRAHKNLVPAPSEQSKARLTFV